MAGAFNEDVLQSFVDSEMMREMLLRNLYANGPKQPGIADVIAPAPAPQAPPAFDTGMAFQNDLQNLEANDWSNHLSVMGQTDMWNPQPGANPPAPAAPVPPPGVSYGPIPPRAAPNVVNAKPDGQIGNVPIFDASTTPEVPTVYRQTPERDAELSAQAAQRAQTSQLDPISQVGQEFMQTVKNGTDRAGTALQKLHQNLQRPEVMQPLLTFFTALSAPLAPWESAGSRIGRATQLMMMHQQTMAENARTYDMRMEAEQIGQENLRTESQQKKATLGKTQADTKKVEIQNKLDEWHGANDRVIEQDYKIAMTRYYNRLPQSGKDSAGAKLQYDQELHDNAVRATEAAFKSTINDQWRRAAQADPKKFGGPDGFQVWLSENETSAKIYQDLVKSAAELGIVLQPWEPFAGGANSTTNDPLGLRK